MSVDEMLGQMTQLDLSTILYPNRTLNVDLVRQHARLKVGSYLNAPTFTESDTPDTNSITPDAIHGFSAPEWRALIQEIQQIYMEEAGIPVLYGIDSVHGAIYVRGATIFGQQINAAATFNPDLVYAMGRITGRDTEAAGIPWVFGPILEIAQNPLWSRTFETFGEDPYLVSVMADAIVRGLQSNNQTAACMKHLIGYSKTPTGHDRDGVTISDFDLLNYFAPPFLAAIKAGAKTAMESYISVNGVPVIGNTKILQSLVRNDMQFDGVIVSDWAEIFNLHEWHHVAKSHEDAVRITLTKTPLDLSMVPYNTSFISMAKNVVQQIPELQSRIKTSARRLLQLKSELGLLDRPVPGESSVELVGSNGDREIALSLARESIVLLENKNKVLPLPKSSRVFLTGPSADNIGNLCGGWTVKWQGVSGNEAFPRGISIKKGMESVQGNPSQLSYFNGLSVNGSYSPGDLAKAQDMAQAAEYTIIALGEGPYAEKPGDLDDLDLPPGQGEYVRAIASTGTKVIVLLVGGRPRLLRDLPKLADAVLYALLPGEVGGQAVAEIIFGDVNPSGRLPITYPKDPANIAIPYNHRVTTRCASGPCEMQWEFGRGLSYSRFEYSDLAISKSITSGRQNDDITVSVKVQNVEGPEGKETVMLFLTQPYREISVPEVKQLKKFAKISLKPGEAKVVSFTLSHEDWSVYDPQIGQGFNRVVEDSDFVVSIKPEMNCLYDSSRLGTNGLCATFRVQSNVV
ncbi:hypothetical protein Poli38472_000904 [Pythium oligandrum]|uniref:beta-glucosidase n=1 Tax=Pythium oligandrum TaxID=41045 RepID=A0A8K1CCS7_PYTOL|nr:hypothetical protein Poli38472_000904 [Pythium oligandrum]|eukprot:TMW60862.1 hypothetical protein Poli38472_000904 [Pythium oligandrum]